MAEPQPRTLAAARRTDLPAAEPIGLLATRLVAHVAESEARVLLHVAAGERRADRLGRLLRRLAPDFEIAVVPAWDCLPFDRASPSREVMGRRTVALSRLAAEPRAPRIVVTTPEALMQRVPPRRIWREVVRELRTGAPLDLDALARDLERFAYVIDERVDEPGEAALRGQVVDIFPAGAVRPIRVEHEDGCITALRRYDPLTQLTTTDLEAVRLHPVSEYVLPKGDEPVRRHRGVEHRLPELYPDLETLFDYCAGAELVLEAGTDERREAMEEQIADCYDSRKRLGPARSGGPARLPPERLYLTEPEWEARLADHAVVRLAEAQTDTEAAPPRFATLRKPDQAFAAFAREQQAEGRRVVLTGDSRALRRLSRAAEAALGSAPEPVETWDAVLAAKPGSTLALRLDLDAGFVDTEAGVAVVAAPDLLGSRAAGSVGTNSLQRVELAAAETDFRLGDAVVHLDHGLGVLRDLETVAAPETGEAEMIRLDYADADSLLVPVAEIGRIWRYGGDPEAVSLDRLDGNAWPKRRARIEAEIAETARRLVVLAREREGRSAPKLVPPRRTYERFAARFPFVETPDQMRAIDETLDDLASGRPMDRLVCGDVGFGKTEVALRAAAAAALAGKQVAVVAPTTVLVRQHVETFRRRFAGFGLEIAHLSRLVKPADAKAVKAGLADGRIRIVIGTHALAGKGVRFADLGLVVIDEEQRFGRAHKTRLRQLADDAHVLTLTATPIPRTLQAALVGLHDLSILATPPAQRRPIRTFLIPFDAATVREALLRERRRGGQSFLVCPRIEDIEPMRARLAELAPELDLLVAHGGLSAEEIDDAMVRFAEGDGDVLLATNIVESGLDVPCANTMLVWRADRFGLAQLHQLRGRVGRGRARGIAYLLTDPETRIAPATRKRLSTLEALDRLGAGFAISARDLDQRGAGDLFGEEQAGHVKLIGPGLYEHLLAHAVALARGEAPEADWTPEIHVGAAGAIPADYVPEPEVRLNVHAELARAADAHAVEAVADAIEDRFGPPPDPVRRLLALARLTQACRRCGIARLDAGPDAVAITPRPEAEAAVSAAASGLGLEPRGERFVWPDPTTTEAERFAAVEELLDRLGEEGGG